MRKIPLLEKNCLICKKIFFTHTWKIRQEKGKYCSRKCSFQTKLKDKVKLVCDNCKFNFLVIPSRKNTAKFCSDSCRQTSLLKKSHTPESWQKISKALKGCTHGFKRGELVGNKNPMWNNNATVRNYGLKWTNKYRMWARAIRRRDGKCTICGSIENLHADHIKEFRNYPHLRFDLNNGRTLCAKCHFKTPNYGIKAILMERNYV